MSEAKKTTDHDEIRNWAESRGGRPARVKGAEGPSELLRIDFDPPDDSFEIISWERFFEIFDQEKLAFLYQDKTEGGETSRFNKLVDRD